MKMRDLIPEGVINYVKLLRNKAKYKGREIHSPHILGTAILGDKCIIGKDVLIGDVEIGDRTYIQEGTKIISGKIGRFCSIAYNCQIGLPEHPTNYISTSPKTYSAYNIWGFDNLWTNPKPPVIGSDVWIGSNVIVSRGVTIGHGAIIGAGAIVTKDIPSYAIAVGVPAKVIKYRFDEETINALNDFKWWELSEEELMQYKDIFELGNKAPIEVLNRQKTKQG